MTPPSPSVQVVARLPFTYAKRHGVLTADIEDGRVVVLCRPGATVLTLAEVRRLVGQPLKLKNVSAEKNSRPCYSVVMNKTPTRPCS